MGWDFSTLTKVVTKDGAISLGFVFEKREVNITDHAFRLCKDYTFFLFSICWFLTCVTYWGSVGAIKCWGSGQAYAKCKNSMDMDKLVDVADRYCFIQSTFTFPDEYPDVPGMPGVGLGPPKGEHGGAKYQAYYIWVPYVLFSQAFMFLLPYTIWNKLEGNRIDNFRKCGCELKKYDIKVTDDVEKKLKKLAAVFLNLKKYKLNLWYSRYYVLCELLNLIIVVFNLYLTDIFLTGKLRRFGYDVFSRMMNGTMELDSAEYTFPKITKCEFRLFGPSKDIQILDFTCLLPINVINERIYLVIWFWLWALILPSSAALVYRFCLIVSPTFRCYILARTMMKKDRTYLPVVLKGLPYSDWFLLKLMSDNFMEILFGQLCRWITEEMEGTKEDLGFEIKVALARPIGIVSVCRHEATRRDLDPAS